MSDFDYRKYSLQQLENWLYDAMSAGEATPQEIYDVIVGVVKDNYYTYKHQTSQAYELLALLNGNGKELYDSVMKEKEYYEPSMPPWGHSDMEALRYTEEELNAMCDKAASDQEKEKCREYNLREAEYYDKRSQLDMKKDKVKKWILPTELDGLTGDVIINLPDDLLEAADLKEGDMINWIDNGDRSYTMTKVTKPLEMDEC